MARAFDRPLAAVRQGSGGVLAGFRGQGLSFLIAEQNVKFLDLADRVYTIEGGRIGFSSTVAAMHADDALHRAYFGLK